MKKLTGGASLTPDFEPVDDLPAYHPDIMCNKCHAQSSTHSNEDIWDVLARELKDGQMVRFSVDKITRRFMYVNRLDDMTPWTRCLAIIGCFAIDELLPMRPNRIVAVENKGVLYTFCPLTPEMTSASCVISKGCEHNAVIAEHRHIIALMSSGDEDPTNDVDSAAVRAAEAAADIAAGK